MPFRVLRAVWSRFVQISFRFVLWAVLVQILCRFIILVSFPLFRSVRTAVVELMVLVVVLVVSSVNVGAAGSSGARVGAR